MLFPLIRFWTYSPRGYFAAVIWNCSELIGFPCPFAPTLFGWITGASSKIIKRR